MEIYRQPAHALTSTDVTRAVRFIVNYANDHGILLPGRIPGYKRCDLQLLPSNRTKKSVWELFVAATESVAIRVSSYRAFLLIWKTVSSTHFHNEAHVRFLLGVSTRL